MHVAVVGAGILGASAAWHLVRADAQVTVVDAAHERRATAAGAGIICPWVSGNDDPALYRLYCDGGAYYREIIPALAEDGETDLGFGQVGALVVSDDAEELSGLYRLLQQRRTDTPEMGEVSRLTSREARVMFPPLRGDLAAVHVSGGGRVDGRRMAAGLLRAAQRRGAVLRKGHAELIERGVRLNGETIMADRVIVASGAWAPELLRPLGVTLRIEPQRGQIVHLHMLGQDTAAWPVIFPLSGHYLLAFDDSRVVVGATREAGVGFDYRVTAAGQAEVLTQALHVAPGLGSATIIETRVGFRPVGPARPVLGYASGSDWLIIGNGLGAVGLTIGPLGGRMLADAALGR